jgi:hypothetical protein
MKSFLEIGKSESRAKRCKREERVKCHETHSVLSAMRVSLHDQSHN